MNKKKAMQRRKRVLKQRIALFICMFVLLISGVAVIAKNAGVFGGDHNDNNSLPLSDSGSASSDLTVSAPFDTESKQPTQAPSSQTQPKTSAKTTTKTTTAVNVTPERVNKMADKILDELQIEGLSVEAKAKKIYTWVRKNVGYVYHGEKGDVYKGAYNAFTKKSGDCYTYYAVSEVLLTRAGIKNMGVTRVGGKTKHFWNIIQTEDELWYFYDSCPSSKSKRDTHFFTVKVAKEETSVRGNNYYVYNESLYPEVVAE